MHYYYKMSCSGGKDQGQSGYQLEIKIQNIFIKGKTKDKGKIRLLGLWMKVEDVVPQTLRSLRWLNHISKIYFLQPT